MKSLKIPIYVFSFILILLLMIFFIERFIAGISFTDVSFWGNTKESAYTIVDEIGDLYLLNTTEYRVKLIFPYDFIDRDINWSAVKEIHEQGKEPDEDQRKNLKIYQSCLDAGIDPSVDLFDFIILTAVVKAGINISDSIYDNPEMDREDRFFKYGSITESDKGQSIELLLPDAEITDFYIEDRRPDSDNFPDAELTPGQWRDLIIFLNPLIMEKVVRLGILENAGENNRKLIEKILKDSGFSAVSFTGRDL